MKELNRSNEESYVSLVQKIERHGLQSVDSDILKQLISSLDRERKLKSTQNAEKHKALSVDRRMREAKALERTDLIEKTLCEEEDNRRADRIKKMDGWYMKLVERDKTRAAEKKELMGLVVAASEKRRSFEVPRLSKTETLFPESGVSSGGSQKSLSSALYHSGPETSSRSTLEEFNALAFRCRKRRSYVNHLYLAQMQGSNYAKSTKQASMVYGQMHCPKVQS